MIMTWGVPAAVAALCGLWIAWPFLRRGLVEPNDADQAISIYRDQIDELRRDFDNGLINEADLDAARQEIEARALAAAGDLGGGVTVSRRSPALAVITVGLCLAGSVTLYAYSGAPGEQDRPFAERRQQMLEARAAAGDVNSRIRLLVDRTNQDPDQLEDWWVLARAYTEIGDHASAADAYRQAASLSGDDPNILSAYGESLTLANGNKVPQAARLIFEQILNGRPDPRARYYLALAKAQAQQFDAALEDWAALARDSDPNAPWMGLVRRDIVNMARFTGRDLNVYLPDASEAELTLAATGPAPQSAPTARGDKDSLTQRLAENPRDYKAWITLARLETADGDQDAAKAALESARQAYAGAPFVLGKIAEAERELGLDLVAARRGPSEEDRQAAALMTEEERQEMIAGMVAGLAARLEERPNDPDGWVMLVRSYVVMGRPEEAGRAAERARFVFTDRPDVLAAIERGIGDVLGD